ATAYSGDAVPTTADYTGRGRRPTPKYPDEPLTCKDLIIAAGRDNCRQITWRHGSRRTPTNPDAELSGQFSVL
ncbi:transposase, partial [Gordonia sp. TBRC 11910]